MRERLVGPCITLRRYTRRDAAELAKAAHDRDIHRNTWIPYPYRIEDSYIWIARSHKFWRKGYAYPFAITLTETGEIVGGIGIEMLSKRHRSGEVGYWIAKAHRRQGYVSEAIQLTLDHGFKDLKLHRIQAHVFVGNEPSVGVLKKAGFTYEGIVRHGLNHRGRWKDLHRFSMLKGDWKPKPK